MDTILVYQDSVQFTEYDFANVVRTIKGFDMDPLSIVPSVFGKDGVKETLDVNEYLDYAFGDCHASACICGYLSEESSVLAFVNAYNKYSSRAPIVARPSFIDGEGNILVEEAVYYSVCDYLLPRASLLIINSFEAELLAEIECTQLRNFQLAAKKIGNEFGCSVWILSSNANDNTNIVYDGVHIRCFADPEKPFNPNYSIKTTAACQLVWGKPVFNAIKDSVVFLSEVKDDVEDKAKEPTPVVETTSEDNFTADIDFPNSHKDEVAELVSSEAPVEIEEKAEPVIEATIEPAIEEVVVEEVAIEEPVEEKIIAEEPTAQEVVTEPVKEESPARPSSYYSSTLSRTAIPTANILKERLSTTSVTTTSSLISPAKSIRDIARTLGTTTVASDSEKPAVTSSLKKESDNQRTLNELASLRERMNRLKSSAEPKSARIDDITALGN